VSADVQAPWLLPCGCNRTDVRSPLDHRPDCPTRRPDPATFNITAAAQAVVIAQDADPEAARAAYLIWAALTGLHGQPALDYAHRLTLEAPAGPTIAYTPPL
jgi:hypothetical protein